MQLNFGDEEGFIISGITMAGEKPLGKAVVYLLSTEGEVLKRTVADVQGRFKLYYVERDSYMLKAAWSSKNSNEPENWPEGTYFEIDRDLQVDRELDFDIDMQADIVRNTKNSEIIKGAKEN